MKHRSFRLTVDGQSKRRVIPHLRVIHTTATCTYYFTCLVVLAVAFFVGSHTEFYADGKPNWPVLVGFSTIVVLSVEFVRLSFFQAVKRGVMKYTAGRWLTSVQAEQFPGLDDPWPDSWLEPPNWTTIDL